MGSSGAVPNNQAAAPLRADIAGRAACHCSSVSSWASSTINRLIDHPRVDCLVRLGNLIDTPFLSSIDSRPIADTTRFTRFDKSA